MSLEKLEINKFSHDTSLTGDGSNNSPLGINFNGITGLKPYTERLLFSAELSGVSSIELPTSKNHFERLRFVLGAQNWKENGLESKEFGTEPTAIHLNFKNGAGGNAYWVGTYGTWTDDRHLTIQKSKNVYGSYSNANITGNISWTADDINCIKEIYGINEYPRYNFYGFSSIGGDIESNINEGYSGDIATLTTIPETEDWKCSALNITGATLTGNDFMFTNSNVSAQAEFEHNKTLTLIDSEHAVLSADKDKGFIGDVVTVTGTMDEGWYLTGFNTTGATMTGNKFAFAGEDVTVEGLYTDEGFPVTYEVQGGGTLTGETIAIPGQPLNIESAYNTYWRLSGFDLTGGYIQDNQIYPSSAPFIVKAVYKPNAFTATGGFEKGSNVSLYSGPSERKNIKYTTVGAKYATRNASTGDIPASWYSTSNRWHPSNASAYKITINAKMGFTGNNSNSNLNGGPVGYVTAVSLIGSTQTQSQTYSHGGARNEGNWSFAYSKSFTSNSQNINYGLSARLGTIGWYQSTTVEGGARSTYVAANTTGSWTATGYAP